MARFGNYDPSNSVSETGNWNVARSYSQEIVMEHYRNLIQLRQMARRGHIEFSDQFVLSPEVVVIAKHNGLIWYAQEILDMITDIFFAIKKKGNPEKILSLKDSIKNTQKVIPSALKTIMKKEGSIRIINEEKHYRILELLTEIHEKMLFLLNEDDLIYYTKEYDDPDEIKRQIMEDVINNG